MTPSRNFPYRPWRLVKPDRRELRRVYPFDADREALGGLAVEAFRRAVASVYGDNGDKDRAARRVERADVGV